MARAEPLRYGIDSYDSHFCLRPPLLLLCCIAFLCKDFLLPLVVAASSMKGGPNNLGYLLEGGFSVLQLGSMIPALLVLYAYVRRVPTANSTVRWIWRHGRLLLLAGLVVEMGVKAQELRSARGLFQEGTLGTSMFLVTALVFFLYLGLSNRVRDSFKDFPQALSPENQRPS